MNGYDTETMRQTCAGCVFQIRDSDNKQIGCEFNRPEKFRNTVEVWRDEDEGSFFFERKCNRWRDESWLNTYTENKLAQAKLETSVKYSVMVYINGSTQISEVETTLLSLNEQTIKPQIIIFIVNNGKHLFVREIMNLFSKHNINIHKKINFVLEKGKDVGYYFDINIKKVEGSYISFCNAGWKYPKNYSDQLEYYYNEQLEYLSMITGANAQDNGLTIQRTLYRALGGFTGVDPEGELEGDIVDKIWYMARKENKEYHIKNWSQFING